jgi:hypothetical protein
LNAEGNGTIVWSNGLENGSTFELNDSQTLVATITSTEGCTSQAEWNLDVLPLPSAEYIVVGQQLIALDGDAWQWYLNNQPIEGATSNSFTMTTEGIYSVEVTAINGCSTMSNYTNYVLSMEEASELGIRIYPNPVENEFRIDLPAQGVFNIELRDLTGRLVASRSNCQTNCTIQREGYAGGVYELLIMGEGTFAHQRIVFK